MYKVYGDYISNVATFKMEKSKSAIQTAARGLNIAVEDALYLSSLITVERGQCYTLNDMYYGDKEKPTLSSMRDVEQSSTVFYWEGV